MVKPSLEVVKYAGMLVAMVKHLCSYGEGEASMSSDGEAGLVVIKYAGMPVAMVKLVW